MMMMGMRMVKAWIVLQMHKATGFRTKCSMNNHCMDVLLIYTNVYAMLVETMSLEVQHDLQGLKSVR